jgi:uncharacterized membrane protein
VTDEKLESMIGDILRVGVLSAAIIVSVSGVFYLIQHHADPVPYGTFEIENTDLRTLQGILHSSIRLNTEAMIQLGLVLLIATPVARVALAAIGFYLERDRLYFGVSIIVLSILIFSLTHST